MTQGCPMNDVNRQRRLLRRLPLLSLAIALASNTAVAIEEEHWDLVQTYCTECHNLDDYAGGIAFELLDPAAVPTEAATWEKVIRKLKAGMMPPPENPRPEQQQLLALVEELEHSIDAHAADNPVPGVPLLRRLNRTEYQNAIRDLLALPTRSYHFFCQNPCFINENFSGRRQHHVTVTPFKQRNSQPVLQLTNGIADGRRHTVKILRCSGLSVAIRPTRFRQAMSPAAPMARGPNVVHLRRWGWRHDGGGGIDWPDVACATPTGRLPSGGGRGGTRG